MKSKDNVDSFSQIHTNILFLFCIHMNEYCHSITMDASE